MLHIYKHLLPRYVMVTGEGINEFHEEVVEVPGLLRVKRYR